MTNEPLDIKNWLKDASEEEVDWKAERLAECLLNPIDFPSFSKALVPGDKVAIPIASNVPSQEKLLTLLVPILERSGVAVDHLWIVLGLDSSRLRESVQRALVPLGVPAENVVTHDPKEEKELEFLAADEDAEAIYVNRYILDADVVLPIVGLRQPEGAAYFGTFGIAPWFLDQHTQRRIRSLAIDRTQEGSFQRICYGNWIGQLSGVAMVLAVEPKPTLADSELLAGTPEAIEQRILSLGIGSSAFDAGEEDLEWIVCHVGGRAEHQTWEEVAQIAADLATQVKQEGSLVICSELSRRPNGALRLLAGIEDEDQNEAKLLKTDLPHALAALQLMNATRRIHIYLMSQLENGEVESLGIVAVKNPEDIQHLIRHSNQGRMVAQSQYVALGAYDRQSFSQEDRG